MAIAYVVIMVATLAAMMAALRAIVRIHVAMIRYPGAIIRTGPGRYVSVPRGIDPTDYRTSPAAPYRRGSGHITAATPHVGWATAATMPARGVGYTSPAGLGTTVGTQW